MSQVWGPAWSLRKRLSKAFGQVDLSELLDEPLPQGEADRPVEVSHGYKASLQAAQLLFFPGAIAFMVFVHLYLEVAFELLPLAMFASGLTLLFANVLLQLPAFDRSIRVSAVRFFQGRSAVRADLSLLSRDQRKLFICALRARLEPAGQTISVWRKERFNFGDLLSGSLSLGGMALLYLWISTWGAG